MTGPFTRATVANVAKIEVATLRYWEREFPEHLPQNGFYSAKHLGTVQEIKRLLRDELISLKGVGYRLGERAK